MTPKRLLDNVSHLALFALQNYFIFLVVRGGLGSLISGALVGEVMAKLVLHAPVERAAARFVYRFVLPLAFAAGYGGIMLLYALTMENEKHVIAVEAQAGAAGLLLSTAIGALFAKSRHRRGTFIAFLATLWIVFIIFAQVSFSVFFARRFVESGMVVRIILCAVYPFCIQVFETSVLFLSSFGAVSRQTVFLYTLLSQIAASLPYRFLYPLFAGYTELILIICVEFVFKIIIQPLLVFMAGKSEWFARRVRPSRLYLISGTFLIHSLADFFFGLGVMVLVTVMRRDDYIKYFPIAGGAVSDEGYEQTMTFLLIGLGSEVVISAIVLVLTKYASPAARVYWRPWSSGTRLLRSFFRLFFLASSLTYILICFIVWEHNFSNPALDGNNKWTE